MREIKSSCCCLGLGDEVHVLKSECPIEREEGQREIKNREECTCIYESMFGDGIPRCKYYEGIRYDEENKGYYVTCSYNS